MSSIFIGVFLYLLNKELSDLPHYYDNLLTEKDILKIFHSKEVAGLKTWTLLFEKKIYTYDLQNVNLHQSNYSTYLFFHFLWNFLFDSRLRKYKNYKFNTIKLIYRLTMLIEYLQLRENMPKTRIEPRYMAYGHVTPFKLPGSSIGEQIFSHSWKYIKL